MVTKRTDIKVVLDDTNAHQGLDRFLEKLERAHQLARSLTLGGGAGQDEITGAPVAGANTRSTADGSGGGPRGGSVAEGTRGGADDTGGFSKQEWKGNLLHRGGMMTMGALQGGAGAFVSGRSDPAWGIRMMGRAIGAATESLAKGIANIAGLFGDIPIIGDTIGGGGKMAAATIRAVSSIKAMGVETQYRLLQEMGAMERPTEIGRVVGGGDIGFGSAKAGEGAKWGFKPQEAVNLLSSYYRSIGAVGAGSAPLPFEAVVSGITPEMMARYISLGSEGGGAVQGVPAAGRSLRKTIGVAQTLGGLRGARVDEWLARIAASTTMMAEQGIHLDLDALNKTAGVLMATGSQYTSESGRNVFGGMGGIRSALKLAQLGPSAAGGLRGSFGQLGQAAIQAHAFGQAGSYLDAIGIMERLGQDPAAVIDVYRELLGDEGAALAFAGGGFSAEQASILGGGELATGSLPGGTLGGARSSSQPISAQLAKQERELLQVAAAVGGKDAAKQRQAILEAVHIVNKTLVGFSDGAAVWIGTINDALKAIMD